MNYHNRLPSPFRSLRFVDPELMVESRLPIPFEMDWSVTDKTGEEIDCIATGFYCPDFDELQEVTLIDGFKNDITLLFVDDDELEEMILHYNSNHKN